MHLLIVRNCLLRYVIRRMARPPDRMKSTVRHCDIFRQRASDSFFVALTTVGTTGTIPVEWRRATIVPLLKPGKSPELLESYRPISLTSIVSKVAEKMVLKRLLWVWMPHPHQYAYRSMRTTTMQLAHLIHEVEHNRNHYFQVSLPKKSGIGNQLHYRPHRTLLVLVDFSKAFDSIDHRVLSRLLANIPG
ncbi:putative Endonuclease-reverse transcriptase/Reverse transcriptase (RNA-dependent DNA polymerase) [Trypanosoma cruzi]|uniref:Putative Endonuclease-reverse transcriptase/Reverse transcriptase (RNA-dependent DNA polymerase) n=1 Tax=Trypanosoma cruzi TaxID=5693 RepID=A0A2V2ULS0_TRYCR|nr:putative Endonuclease-reverse transcriptase/Reverse transcriptase (RNA-dependent DNA polymerase) [Trypanosoma cruzi]